MKSRTWTVIITLGVALLLTPAAKAIGLSQLNIFYGLPTWPSILFYPDSSGKAGGAAGGGDVAADSHCEMTKGFDPLGGGPQMFLICAAVPDASTKYWNAGMRFTPYSGHATNQWPRQGFDIAAEPLFPVTDPSNTHVYSIAYDNSPEGWRQIWDFQTRQGVFSIGQTNKPVFLWSPGGASFDSWVHASGGFSTKDVNGVWTVGVTKTGTCLKFLNGLCVQ